MKTLLSLAQRALGSLFALALLAGCPEKTQGAGNKRELPPAGLAGASDPASSAPASAPAAAASQPRTPLSALAPDAVIAEVNGEALTRADLERAMIHQAALLGFPPGELPARLREVIEQPAYEQLIRRELLRQEAKRRGLEASDADIEKEKQKLVSQLPEGRTFEDVLKKMHTDEKKFYEDLKADLSIARLMAELQQEMPVVDEEAARRIYETQKERYAANEKASASHILVAVAPDAPPDVVAKARERAEQIRQEVNGKDAATFRKVAIEKSDDPKAKETGGDLGTFERREVLPAFADAAFQLKEEEISPVIRTDKGFHIIRGQGVTKGPPKPFEEVKDRIIAIETLEQRMRFQEDFLNNLEAKATVERRYEPRPSPAMQMMGQGASPGMPPVPMPSPEGMPAHLDAAHKLPLPSQDNVLPGVHNPHGAGDLKLDPNAPGSDLQLKVPKGSLSTP